MTGAGKDRGVGTPATLLTRRVRLFASPAGAPRSRRTTDLVLLVLSALVLIAAIAMLTVGVASICRRNHAIDESKIRRKSNSSYTPAPRKPTSRRKVSSVSAERAAGVAVSGENKDGSKNDDWMCRMTRRTSARMIHSQAMLCSTRVDTSQG